VFYAGEDAATHVPENVKNYIPTDYEIDGVADAKWNEYSGAVAALKTTDASGKTFTAKAIMGSNGLYFIAEAKHEYYFDNNVPNGEWANQYNTPGVAGVTNIAVAIGNDNSPRLHFTVSKYGVYACGGGTGANVIGTMKTTDSGVEGSKTRYTSVAECFVPMPVLEANGGYTDANKDSANMQLVFVSYNGDEKDNLETAGNYYTASNTDWKWTWPLAVPLSGALNSFARDSYMHVTEEGITLDLPIAPRNTGKNGKTGGITLEFTNGSTHFTETADAKGIIHINNSKPAGTYTVRGKLFGGELKFPDVTLHGETYTGTITHTGTWLNYGEGSSAIVDYETSSINLGSAANNTVLLGTQNITGEVWFTMKITMPSRSDYNGFRFILAPDVWGNQDFVEFLHNGETGFIKFQGENAYTINSADIGTAMNGGNLYVAFARTADKKFKMAWATTADGLKSAAVKEYTSKTDGAAIGQIGFTNKISMDGASVNYISSGTTLDAAIAEMNGYAAKDAPAAQ